MTKFFCFLIVSLFSKAIFAANSPEIVEFQTNLGTIVIKPDYINAPISSDNFMTYVEKGHYKNTLIHRSIKDFIIQGGGYNRVGILKTTLNPIINESTNGLKNLTATIAMARTNNPNSATSQFFINLKNNNNLDYINDLNAGYAVFGKITKGMNVVRAIENRPTFNDFPFTNNSPIYIENVYTTYTINRYIAKIRITVKGDGRVSSEDGLLNCTKKCAKNYAKEQKIKITAKANNDSTFKGWSGDCRGLRRVLKLNTNHGNHNCTANFIKLGAFEQ